MTGVTHSGVLGVSRPDSGLVDALSPSPNHGERVGIAPPDCLILHYTGMADGPSAINWLCNPDSQVSCHYVVEEDGRVLQLVAEARRAWHAGRSSWAGNTDMNSASIGIEIVNAGHPGGLPDYPDAQIASVIALCRDLVGRHPIPPERVLAHSDVAPGRKEDPGERFPWSRLFEAGVGLWVPPRPDQDGPALLAEDHGAAVASLQTALQLHGYDLEASGTYDPVTEAVVRAFQLHFRPERVDGVADAATVAILRDLLDLRAARSS